MAYSLWSKRERKLRYWWSVNLHVQWRSIHTYIRRMPIVYFETLFEQNHLSEHINIENASQSCLDAHIRIAVVALIHSIIAGFSLKFLRSVGQVTK